MRAKFVVVAVAAAVSAVCAAEGDARFPFVVSYGGADNATSVAHLLDAPAGGRSFIVEVDEDGEGTDGLRFIPTGFMLIVK